MRGSPASLSTLADRLKYAREQKGLTQQQLADICGVAQQTIDAIEGGVSLKPRKIDAISRALEVSPAWLQFGVEEIDNLDADSITLAQAWMNLEEPFKTAVKQMVLSAAKKGRGK